MNKKYVEGCGDGLMIREKGVEVIVDGGEVWGNENNGEVVEVKKRRRKRGVSDEMEGSGEYMKEELLCIGIEFKRI